MRTRGDRTKRERNHGRNRDPDWFAEDQLSDPDLASLGESREDWEPDLWGTIAEDLEDLEVAAESDDEDSGEEDDYDGWGPVRRRTKRRRRD